MAKKTLKKSKKLGSTKTLSADKWRVR